MFSLYAKILRDKRFFIVGWAIGLAFLSFLMVIFYPSFNGGQVDSLMDTMPAALQGLVGDLQDWRELPGYIGGQIFDIRLPIFISILSILLAISLSVGEEDKGQLRTLISLPMSRRKIVFAKFLGIFAICFLASVATAAGVVIGLVAINESIDYVMLARLILFTWLLVTALASVIFAIGSATGKRSITTAMAIILTIGGFLLSTFALAVDWLQDYEFLSFFYYFPAVDIAKGTIEWWNAVFYGAVIFVSLLVAWVFFPRRDVKS